MLAESVAMFCGGGVLVVAVLLGGVVVVGGVSVDHREHPRWL